MCIESRFFLHFVHTELFPFNIHNDSLCYQPIAIANVLYFSCAPIYIFVSTVPISNMNQSQYCRFPFIQPIPPIADSLGFDSQ